ncbi:N-acetylglucosamine kinase [Paenibacillus allorhizosphaerae]|uniref:N-acetylmuramic acid/N-acetylglucosamine kinase n=1 Tax=Paenibacillus allorhizosphaerae TaxID=2849866 RepID=A0ABM8VPM2_9BACL|nr:BadF/BadG/BcrA/BcrD ATPase family protein [Paenibacillus allorhizosphaerae]CAG7652693.1 N-acetylmuramic acid/N-acetylglucosamine kinase [Paenibacillus allorhizosphaerae]
MKQYLVGIDGGGSKTEAILFEMTSETAHTISSGGINSIVEGVDAASLHLKSLIAQICDIVKTESGQVLSMCIGSAAIVKETDDHWILTLLRDAFPEAKLRGFIDSRIALEGALGGRPGVVVIAGTGSIAYARRQDGTTLRCGGWGPWFGDEGSGYSIGCDALRAVVMALDGRGKPTLLTERLLTLLEVQHDLDIIDKVYGGYRRKEIASLAVEVAACAAQKDEIALRILDDAGRRLAEHLLTLANRVDWESPPALSYAGGVFRMGEAILNPLKSHLGEWSRMLQEPHRSPAHGAVMLALKELQS